MKSTTTKSVLVKRIHDYEELKNELFEKVLITIDEDDSLLTPNQKYLLNLIVDTIIKGNDIIITLLTTEEKIEQHNVEKEELEKVYTILLNGFGISKSRLYDVASGMRQKNCL